MIKRDSEEQTILKSVENGEWKSKPNLAERKQELQRYAKYTQEIENVVIEQDVLAAFKATGQGWQTRINNALKEWLNEHPNFEVA